MARWLFLTLLGGCAAEPSGAVGAFEVELTAAPFGFTIRHPSGLELRSADAPIHFREALARIETQFGAFKIEELDRGVEVAPNRTEAQRDGDGLTATLFDADAAIGTLAFEPAGDNLIVRFEAEGHANRARLGLTCDAGAFWGFGAQTHDVDHRGQVVPIFVSEQGIGKSDDDVQGPAWFLLGTRHQSYLPVPTMLAPRAGASYGLHATTMRHSVWDLCSTDPARLDVEVWEPKLELVVSPGPTPSDVVEQQTSLTGRIPSPPPWTFGVWMERIGGQAKVFAEAQKLRQEKIPASAIWTEDWRGGTDLGREYILEEDWRWDRALYPDLPGLTRDLHALGFKFMAYFNTFVVKDRDVWADAQGHLVKAARGGDYLFDMPDGFRAGLADLFADENRAFVKQELKAALDLGIDGWMADFAEWYPADPQDVLTSDGSAPEAAHNRYPIAWAEVNREAVEESGHTDAVIFHRSGYTGSQGKAHVIWAGDQRTSFQEDDGMPTVVPIAIGLGVTGFPVVTHDIGGYMSATNDPTTKELFLRWSSLGALSPVMRTHHGRSAAANWRWDSDAETIAHFRRYAELHTRLFPLFYGLALDARDHGWPITRPIGFHDPGDAALAAVKDEFLVGPSILVAPVMREGATRREIRLPAGAWYDFFDPKTRLEGGRAVEVDAPIGALPLFVREGGVVPTIDVVDSLAGPRLDTRRVLVYLGKDGRARDASGGSFELTSPGRPTAIARIEGGTIEDQGEGFVIAKMSGPALSLFEPDGAAHRLTLDGGSPPELVAEVHW